MQEQIIYLDQQLEQRKKNQWGWWCKRSTEEPQGKITRESEKSTQSGKMTLFNNNFSPAWAHSTVRIYVHPLPTPTSHPQNRLEGMVQAKSIFSQNQRPGLHNILSTSELVSDMSSCRQFYRLAVPTGSAPLVHVLEVDPLCPHYWHFMALRSGVARPFSPLQAWEKTDIISSMPEVTKRNKDNYFLQSLLCASLHAHIT